MIVVDFAVGLIYIPVFEGGIGPSGIGAGIHAIFRIGLIIEILDAGFVSVRAATPIVSSQRTLFHYRFRGIVAHKRDIDIAGIQREPVRTADEIGDVVEITVRPERPPAAVRQSHHDLCA